MADHRPAADIVIVGAGLAGTLMAMELAATGLKIVVLERGRMLDAQHDFAMPYVHDELKFHRHSDIFQDLSRETLTFRNDLSQTALPMREIGSFKLGECVGGAHTHWAGQARRYLPWDFETKSRTVERYGARQMPEDCTSQDWGISFEELEPYYDQFEQIFGVCGKAGNLNGELQPGGNPFEGPRSREFPNPPSPQTYGGALFAQAAASLGYHPHPSPSAAMSQPYTNLYRQHLGQCVHGGFCNGHLCATGAKATPYTAILPALAKHANVELRPLSNVTRVNLDNARRQATGVTYMDARGREIVQPASLVILSSYTFNNVRLLLLSGAGRPYDPVANTGVVGRNYSYQTGGKVTLFFEDRELHPFVGGGMLGTSIDDFNGDNFDHTGLDFFGGAYVAQIAMGLTPIRNHPVPPGVPRWGSEWKKNVARYYRRSFPISLHGGCQSYRGHYLDLDPTYRDAFGLPLLRMTYDWHDNEKKMSRYVMSKIVEIAKAIGPAHIQVDEPAAGRYSIVPYQSTHNIGGAVMGTDPATSVVNRYLQSWDVSNLFVVGGSAFPQQAANSPSGTIGAVACWAADAIKDQYLKRPGALA